MSVTKKKLITPNPRLTRMILNDVFVLMMVFFQSCYLYLKLFEDLCKKADLTVSQFCTLWLLYVTDRPMLASQIVNCVPVEISQVSVLLDHLSERGMIRRRRSRQDRRQNEVYLTQKGRDYFIRISPDIIKAQQQMFQFNSKSKTIQSKQCLREIRKRIIKLSDKPIYEVEFYTAELANTKRKSSASLANT